MEFQIRFKNKALKNLSRLPPSIARLVLDKLRRFVSQFDKERLRPLKGELKGSYKLRACDYRVIYTVDWLSKIIMIESIAHRSKAYKSR